MLHRRIASHCLTCGLPSNYPRVSLDAEGRCDICRSYERIADHVRDYYSRPDPQVLLTEVLAHYEANVVPHVVKLVEQRVRGEGRSVVIEGSALWPGFVSGLMGLPSVRGAWLTLSGDAIEEGVFAESRYTRMPEAEKRLIESFLARTRAYATRMEMEARRLGLPIVSADGLTPEDLARTLMAGAE